MSVYQRAQPPASDREKIITLQQRLTMIIQIGSVDGQHVKAQPVDEKDDSL